MTEADRVEWAAYARTLTLLPGRAVVDLPVVLVTAVVEGGAPRSVVRRPVGKSAAVSVGEAPAGLDKASWQRFRSGKLLAGRVLDLHGRTAQRAHVALQAFLHAAQAEGVRCVEVITGRGSGEGGGVLRRELPHWLNAPGLRHLVLAASHPHAANTGSVRLLLRRTR